MMIAAFFIVASLFVHQATVVPAGTAPPSDAGNGGESGERKTDFLLGDTWSCTTFAGTHLTHRFKASDDGDTISVETIVPLPNVRSATLHEKYSFDFPSQLWSANVANGALVATAPEWTKSAWTFVGNSVIDGNIQKTEMTFVPTGKSGFERTFLHLTGGRWTSYAGETCRRPAAL